VVIWKVSYVLFVFLFCCKNIKKKKFVVRFWGGGDCIL